METYLEKSSFKNILFVANELVDVTYVKEIIYYSVCEVYVREAGSHFYILVKDVLTAVKKNASGVPFDAKVLRQGP